MVWFAEGRSTHNSYQSQYQLQVLNTFKNQALKICNMKSGYFKHFLNFSKHSLFPLQTISGDLKIMYTRKVQVLHSDLYVTKQASEGLI